MGSHESIEAQLAAAEHHIASLRESLIASQHERASKSAAKAAKAAQTHEASMKVRDRAVAAANAKVAMSLKARKQAEIEARKIRRADAALQAEMQRVKQEVVQSSAAPHVMKYLEALATDQGDWRKLSKALGARRLKQASHESKPVPAKAKSPEMLLAAIPRTKVAAKRKAKREPAITVSQGPEMLLQEGSRASDGLDAGLGKRMREWRNMREQRGSRRKRSSESGEEGTHKGEAVERTSVLVQKEAKPSLSPEEEQQRRSEKRREALISMMDDLEEGADEDSGRSGREPDVVDDDALGKEFWPQDSGSEQDEYSGDW